eukprot:165948_1
MFLLLLQCLLYKINAQDTKPNFLIFFVDDLGYYDVSFNGHPTISTPNIDALAYAGIRLQTWYTGFPVCTASRAAMLTGRLPARVGCSGGWSGGNFGPASIGGLDPNTQPTFASILKNVGYKTKIIGKWHLGQRYQFLPHVHGFDEYYGIPYSADMGETPWDPNPAYIPLPLIHNTTIIEQPTDLSTLSIRYTQQATSFIANASVTKEPFLLYIPFSHIHVPEFQNEMFCNVSKRGRFGDSMAELDYSIGNIMKALEQYNVLNNTLVFFTSDNGPWVTKPKIAGGSAGLFRGAKFTTFEGGVRMPSFAYWKGKIKPKSISREFTATYDIFMTIISIANATKYMPNDGRIYDGKDMSDIIFNQNGGKSKHECIYMYGGTPNATNCPFKTNSTKYAMCAGLWAVRCGKYKVHWITRTNNMTIELQNPPLLFNVEMDPSELHPIWANNDYYDDILANLTRKKDQHLAGLDLNITNQILLGSNKIYEQCCNNDSSRIYPQYPNCTCQAENWNQFVCQPQCLSEGDCGITYPGKIDYYDAATDKLPL